MQPGIPATDRSMQASQGPKPQQDQGHMLELSSNQAHKQCYHNCAAPQKVSWMYEIPQGKQQAGKQPAASSSTSSFQTCSVCRQFRTCPGHATKAAGCYPTMRSESCGGNPMASKLSWHAARQVLKIEKREGSPEQPTPPKAKIQQPNT
jgi:hypothetical protein